MIFVSRLYDRCGCTVQRVGLSLTAVILAYFMFTEVLRCAPEQEWRQQKVVRMQLRALNRERAQLLLLLLLHFIYHAVGNIAKQAGYCNNGQPDV